MSDLGKALEPIIRDIVTEELREQDIAAKIKAAIDEVTANIPVKVLEVKDFSGTVRQFNTVHRNFELLLKIVSTGNPVLLKGEAGTGKTHGAAMVAEALGLDFHSMSVGEQTTKSDILGFIDAQGAYRETAFRRAFENGGLFLMDEVDAGNPNVLLAINSGLSNGFIDFPDGQVRMHPDFRFIATANTFGNGGGSRYVGRNKLDAATVNRFIPLVWELDEEIEAAIVANDNWLRVVRAARKLAAEQLEGVIIGMRNAKYGAELLQAGIDFDTVFSLTILGGLGEDAAEILSEAKKSGPEIVEPVVEEPVEPVIEETFNF